MSNNVGNIFPRMKTLSGLEIFLFILLGLLLWVGVAMGLAFFVDWSLTQFGADWSDFWGWTILLGVAPVVRAWIFAGGK